jgi:hypothetical protein
MQKSGKRYAFRRNTAKSTSVAPFVEIARMNDPEAQDLLNQLAAPFEMGVVKAKPGSVNGSRAMAIFYIDCRAVQNRLDEVLGPLGWEDSYKLLPDGTVLCRLRCRFGTRWVTKMDVGSRSEQPDDGDKTKAAFSDALKRAAVKFAIGRYLYKVGPMWFDYDQQKRKFAKPPQLPAEFLPRTASAAKREPAQATKPTAPSPRQQPTPPHVAATPPTKPVLTKDQKNLLVEWFGKVTPAQQRKWRELSGLPDGVSAASIAVEKYDTGLNWLKARAAQNQGEANCKVPTPPQPGRLLEQLQDLIKDVGCDLAHLLRVNKVAALKDLTPAQMNTLIERLEMERDDAESRQEAEAIQQAG